MYQRYVILEKLLQQLNRSDEIEILFSLPRFSHAPQALENMVVKDQYPGFHLFDRDLAHRKRCQSTKRHFLRHGNVDHAKMLLRLLSVTPLDQKHRNVIVQLGDEVSSS